MKTFITICMALLCLSATAQETKRVVLRDATVYDVPNGYKSKPIFQLKKGDTIYVMSYEPDYWHIRKNHDYGWILDVKIVAESEDMTYLKKKAPKSIGRIKPTQLEVGMYSGDVLDLLGSPDKKNITTGDWGTHEQWVYENYYSKVKYVYVENGKVTAWQE